MNYNTTTGLASVNSNDNQKIFVRGVGTTLVSTITIVSVVCSGLCWLKWCQIWLLSIPTISLKSYGFIAFSRFTRHLDALQG